MTFAMSILSLPSAAMPAIVPYPLKLSVEVACNHNGPYAHNTERQRPVLGSGVSSGRT